MPGLATPVLRDFLATHIPPIFGRIQGTGLLPDPWVPGTHITLGERRGGYHERIEGTHRPAKRLSGFGMAAADEITWPYRHRFEHADTHFVRDWHFGAYNAEQVRVWGKIGVHLSDAGTFIDVYCSPAALANPKYELPRLALALAPMKVECPRAIFLGPPWHHNHYHWVIDIVPRLAFARPELTEGLPVVIPPAVRQAQIEILRAALDTMGHQDTQIERLPQGPCRFERLVMPTAPTMSMDVSAAQHGFVRSIYQRQLVERTRRRIYISRRDAAVRRITNEGPLLELLSKHGFEPVTPSGLSMAEQAALFCSAEAVIGHHGAGMTNLAFSNPGTIAIEVFHEGHFAPCFSRLAQLGELRYGYAVGKAQGADTFVDLYPLAQLLEEAGL